jgi:hypothetical protein
MPFSGENSDKIIAQNTVFSEECIAHFVGFNPGIA